MTASRAVLLAVVVLAVAAATRSACRADEFNSLCRPYFGDACSEAIGAWLPRVFDPKLRVEDFTNATVTKVHDEIVDPAGQGEAAFLGQHAVYHGTKFVYGLAGPPQGRVVYDPVHRIAYFDEGCCGWHRIVLASDAAPPPKAVAERSLAGLHTVHGIRLGDAPRDIVAIFGVAPERSGVASGQAILVYRRTIVMPKPYSSCMENDTFLFQRQRLRALEFSAAC